MIRDNGSIRDLSEVWIGRHSISPKVLFTYSIAVMPSDEIANQIFMVIIEIDERFPAERYDDFIKWASEKGIKSIVFVSTNPFSDQTQKLIDSGMNYWGWNHRLLGACLNADKGRLDWRRPFSISNVERSNAISGIRKVVIPIREERLETLFSEARTRQQEIAKSAKLKRNAEVENQSLRYLSAIHALEEMPVPIKYYEEESIKTWGVISIEGRLRALRKGAVHLERSDPSLSAFYNHSIEVLKQIVQETESRRTGKPTEILRIIDAVKGKNSSAIILVRNRAYVRALENFLRDENRGMGFLLQNKIRILTTTEYENLPENQASAMISIMTGLNKRQLNLLRSFRVRTQAFLVYQTQIPSIRYYVNRVESALDSLYSLENQSEFISRLTKEKMSSIKSVESQIRKLPSAPGTEIVFMGAQDATVYGPDVPTFDESFLSEDETTWESDVQIEENDPTIEGYENPSGSEFVSAIPIVLESGQIILLSHSQFVTVYDEYSNKERPYRASKLQIGQTIVIINSSVRKTLADLVIERTEHHPRMFETVVMQRAWIDGLRRGIEKTGDTNETLLRKIQQKGSKIKSAEAIYWWRKGEVIGPQDKDDIGIIGEVYEDDFLQRNTDKIWKAVQKLRSIHRQLASNLRYLIPKYGLALREVKDAEDLAIAKDLNLYLEDFKDAISLEKIQEIRSPIFVQPRQMNMKIDIKTAENLSNLQER
jgi:hypothetical protein